MQRLVAVLLALLVGSLIGALVDPAHAQSSRSAGDPTSPPPNDEVINAIPLQRTTDSTSGTTVGATQTQGDPRVSPAWSNAGGTVWYSWTAPRDGIEGFTLQMDTRRRYVGVLAPDPDRRTGYRVVGDYPVETGDDRTMTRFRATEGRTYLIAVASNEDEGRPFRLIWGKAKASSRLKIITPVANLRPNMRVLVQLKLFAGLRGDRGPQKGVVTVRLRDYKYRVRLRRGQGEVRTDPIGYKPVRLTATWPGTDEIMPASESKVLLKNHN